MNLGDWQAKIVEQFGWAGYELYLWRRSASGPKEALTHDGKLVELKEGLVDPDTYFARFEDREQLQALADAISAFGVKTPDNHHLEGLLEAQAKHLDDMRTLVFKTKRSAS
jgi:hypothetical protein